MESFIAPGKEADALDHSRLDDFFSREDTPRNGIRSITRCIGLQLTSLGGCVVGQPLILFNSFNYRQNNLCRDKQFHITFLEDKPVRRSPTMNAVRRFYTVYGRLRVDC